MIRRRAFGTMPDGRPVDAWDLQDEIGATVLTYGARLAGLTAKIGRKPRPVVLGFPDLTGYRADRSYQGAVVGRYANRIAGGRFELDGTTYQLSTNDRGNTLHGGAVGFDQAIWEAELDGDGVLLRHVSPDGDQGFPGALTAIARDSVIGDALRIDYHATTTAPTVLNLSNHAYFNLNAVGDVLDHVLTIPASRFVAVNAELIPTGELRHVAGTPFDFRVPTRIGSRIDAADEQLAFGHGYDHNFVLADRPRVTAELAATVSCADLAMEVLTTEPGVQLYTGNFLSGQPFPRRAALCLETQHFPDSPNQPSFPSTVLRPGTIFSSTTLYRFIRPGAA
jgi:aldose 1-epimerase